MVDGSIFPVFLDVFSVRFCIEMLSLTKCHAHAEKLSLVELSGQHVAVIVEFHRNHTTATENFLFVILLFTHLRR